MAKLEQAWQALPGFHDIQRIRLHYLAGTIEVEVELPISIIQPLNDTESLRQQYAQAIQAMKYVSQVSLFFH